MAAETSASEEYVQKRVYFGSLARHRGKKATKKKQFDWTVYLRSADGEDMAPWLDSVTFHLHESVPNPIRTVNQAPYEVTESGWGEFEVKMVLKFTDPAEEPVVFTKLVVLYDQESSMANPPPPSRLIHSEFLDIIYFEASKCSATFLGIIKESVPAPGKTPVELRLAEYQEQLAREMMEQQQAGASGADSRKTGSRKGGNQKGRKRKGMDGSGVGSTFSEADVPLIPEGSLTPAEKAEYARLLDAGRRIREELQTAHEGYTTADTAVEQMRVEIASAEATLKELYSQLSDAGKAAVAEAQQKRVEALTMPEVEPQPQPQQQQGEGEGEEADKPAEQAAADPMQVEGPTDADTDMASAAPVVGTTDTITGVDAEASSVPPEAPAQAAPPAPEPAPSSESSAVAAATIAAQ